MSLPKVTQATIWECHNEVVSNLSDTEPYNKLKRDNPNIAAFLEGALAAKGITPMAMFAIAVTMYDALDRQAEKDRLSEIFG